MRLGLGLFLALLAQPAFAEPRPCQARVGFYEPQAGVVASPQIAVKVATTYLAAIYGAKRIAGQQPMVASLGDGVWTVRGSLAPGLNGGVAKIRICRRNGAVLLIVHGK